MKDLISFKLLILLMSPWRLMTDKSSGLMNVESWGLMTKESRGLMTVESWALMTDES